MVHKTIGPTLVPGSPKCTVAVKKPPQKVSKKIIGNSYRLDRFRFSRVNSDTLEKFVKLFTFKGDNWVSLSSISTSALEINRIFDS